jgi:hypothetical protein
MAPDSRRLAVRDSQQLIYRILDQPNLVAAVQSLPPPALGRLINHVGLADAGEIVALATTDQLVRIFDDDLWRSPGPGQDERFDAERFALWLEVMLEAGEDFAARRLAELPEDLVTLAFHKQVLVIDIEALAIDMSSRASEHPADDDVQLEKALESCLCEELGEYRIVARRHEAWDTLFGLLVALDRDHHDFLARLLERLCALDAERIEDEGGLYEVLTAGESLADDVAGEREERRAEQGYIAPSSAAAFLALGRTRTEAALEKSDERDAITRAYFRELRPAPPVRPGAPGTAAGTSTANPDAAPLAELLRAADVLPPVAAARRLAAAAAAPADELTRALRELAQTDPARHADRLRELAYLTNVLAAGASLAGRPLRPVEAATAAVATANLGLEQLRAGQGKRAAARLLADTTVDQLFLVGESLLFHEVVMPAAERAAALLAKAAAATDASALRSALASGKPWTARRRLDGLAARLGQPTFAALAALLDECPTLAGRLAPQGTGSSEFIATQAQLAAARAFLAGLAG